MKKKYRNILIGIVGAVIVLWGAMFVTDYIRCSNFKEPIFVVAVGETADDGGSGTYQGLGYTVEVEKYVDAEYGVVLCSVEMKVLGKVIVAVIS